MHSPETTNELLGRIATDPAVCFGRPHLRRQRVLVSLVLGFLASGSATADVLAEFPALDESDVRACLAFAEARRARARADQGRSAA